MEKEEKTYVGVLTSSGEMIIITLEGDYDGRDDEITDIIEEKIGADLSNFNWQVLDKQKHIRLI